MSTKVAHKIAHALDILGQSPREFLVGLSGGVDSVVLTRVLAGLYQDNTIKRLEVAHVNHNLRPDSSIDAAFAENLAQSLGLAFHLIELSPADFPLGTNTQARARELRLGRLAQIARERGLSFVALAHNADDQAETVLFRLLRGTGPRGICGMELLAVPFVRPMLDVTRGEIEELARESGWSHHTDPTNLTGKYSRNRLRRELMPIARQIAPGADENIRRTAMLLREDDDYLTSVAHAQMARIAVREPEGISLDASELSGFAPPIAKRLVLAALGELGFDLGVFESRHISRILADLGEGVRDCFWPTPGEGKVGLFGGRLWFVAPGRTDLPPIPVMGQSAGVCTVEEVPPGAVWVHVQRLAPNCLVRRKKPGDALLMEGREKLLKNILSASGIPLFRREKTAVFEDGEGLLCSFAPGKIISPLKESPYAAWINEPLWKSFFR